MSFSKNSCFSKIICVILIFATVATVIPMGLTLNSYAAEEHNTQIPEIIPEEYLEEYGIESRDPLSEDSLYSYVMNMKNGEKAEVFYPYPVKYINTDGEIKDKSTAITEANGSFVSLDTDFEASFGKNSNDGVTLSYGKYKVEMFPLLTKNTEGKLFEDGKTVSYESDENTLEYALSFEGIKENIVLTENKGVSSWQFLLKTNGLTLESINGQYVLNDGEETVMCLGSVICVTADEKNNTFGEISVKEPVKENEYTVEISVSSSWLESPETTYPVRIDPSIRINYYSAAGSIQDVSIGPSDHPSSTNDVLYIGKNSGHGLSRAIMCFPNLDIFGKNVTSAKLEIRDVMCNSSPIVQVECYEYKGSPWTESSSLTWTNMSSYGDLLDSRYVKWANGNAASDEQRYSFDITTLAQKWAAGILAPSQGVLFKVCDQQENASGDSMTFFASKDYGSNTQKPSLVITYVNPKGYKPEYTLDTRTLDDKLTVYNYHNYGNILAVYEFDVKAKGFPLPLFYAYNSSTDSWNLSTQVAISEEYGNYKYTDGYGTEYYLTNDGNGNNVNEALGATASPEYTSSAKIIFDNGTTIHYDMSAGEVTSINYDNNTFTYVYGNYGISEIKKNGSTIFTFGYDSAHRLCSAFGYSFDYSNNKIASIKDKYGNYTYFSYTYDSNSRLTKFDANSSLTANGINVSFNTARKATRIATYRGSVSNNITDDSYTYGVGYTTKYSNLRNIDSNDPRDTATKYVFDYNRFTVNEIVSVYGTGEIISATDYRTDDNTSGSIIGKGAINLLSDSSFESSYWTSGTRTEDSEAVMGNHVLSVGTSANKSITLPAGRYCFSAYVKGNDAKAKVTVRYQGTKIAGSGGVKTTNDWIRIYTVFTLDTQKTVTLYIENESANAILYADCVQLEKGTSPTTYNILVNSGFESGTTGWSNASTSYYPIFDTYTCSVPVGTRISQTVNLGSCSKEKSYTVSGWLLSTVEYVFTSIEIVFNNNQNYKVKIPFSGQTSQAQYVCAQVIPPDELADVTSITVSVVNNFTTGDVVFDNLLLSFGDMTRVSDDEFASQNLSYSSNGDGTCRLTGIGTCTDTEIVIPEKAPNGDTVTSISNNAFINNTSIKSVSAGSNITTIGENAFKNCTSLESIYFAGGLTRIGYNAFMYCSSLESIGIPDTVTRIDDVAFGNCTSLESIILPKNLTHLYPYAFSSCSSLKAVAVPRTVSYIDSHCFENCAVDFAIYFEGSSSEWNAVSKGTAAVPSGTVIKCDTEVKDGCAYNYTKENGYVKTTTVKPLDGVGIISEYVYDQNGNITYFKDAQGNESTYSYDLNENLLSQAQNDIEVSFTYDTKGNVTSVTDAEGNTTNYSYNGSGLLESVENDISSVTYGYSTGMLSVVTVRNNGTPTETYRYFYNVFGNITSITVGNIPIASYTYTCGGRGELASKTESNGYTEYYTYDRLGNILTTENDDDLLSECTYDISGNLLSFYDYTTDTENVYYYTPNGLYVVCTYSSGVVGKTVGVDGTAFFADGTEYVELPDGFAVEKETDDSEREITASIKHTVGDNETGVLEIARTFIDATGYIDPGNVKTESFSNGGSFSYTYDLNGNLTEIKEGTSLKVSYVYDSKNELVRENNLYSGKTYVWTYDNNGNIQNKKTYSYTTGSLGSVLNTENYTYGNSSVKDLLTSYNGTNISYSGFNPTNWRNASFISWNGRQMASLRTLAGSLIQYTYDPDGLRTSKTIGGSTTEYIWNEGRLIRQNTGSATMDFLYDGEEIIGFTVGGHSYFYGKDTFGVIRYIYNESGTIITTYKYDAWGNILSVTGSNTSIGNQNPIRYKGYYYDEETGFYYIQSRYYDPEVSRWMSPEPNVYEGGFDSSAGLLAYNVYAYCANNPVMLMDQSGESITLACILIGAGIGLIVGAVGGSHYAKNKRNLSPSDGWNYWKYVVFGGVGGGVLGGLAGWAFAGTSAAASISWAYYKATTAIGTTAYAIGSAFENWFYKAYNVVDQQVRYMGYRFDAIYKNSIVELKNYNWEKYSNLNGVCKSFVNQARNYLQFVGDTINGQTIKGVTFCFSSKPPQAIIDALRAIGITVNWLS